MREIKFRAWVNEKDKEYSRMVHSEQAIVTILGHKYGGKGVAKPAGFSDIDNQPKPERYVLMQYTGLKDKNGKEIYEGDIVQFNGMYEVKLGEHGIPSLLDAEYVDFAYGFYFKAQHDLKDIEPFGFDIPINKQYAKEVEVIGNIYENPELLGVEK